MLSNTILSKSLVFLEAEIFRFFVTIGNKHPVVFFHLLKYEAIIALQSLFGIFGITVIAFIRHFFGPRPGLFGRAKNANASAFGFMTASSRPICVRVQEFFLSTRPQSFFAP